jgi:hypothetical protein
MVVNGRWAVRHRRIRSTTTGTGAPVTTCRRRRPPRPGTDSTAPGRRRSGRRPAAAGRPARRRAFRRGQAHGLTVPPGQPHRLGGRADVLGRTVDLPGFSAPGFGAGPTELQQSAGRAGHRQPADPERAVAESGQHSADQRGAGARRRPGRHRRNSGGVLVGVQVCRRFHARLQRCLRRSGGTPRLEEAADPARGHRRRRDHAGRVGGRGGSSRESWPASSGRRSDSGRRR